MTRRSKSGRFLWPEDHDEVNQQWKDAGKAAACRDCGAVVWLDFEEAHDAWHDRLESSSYN